MAVLATTNRTTTAKTTSTTARAPSVGSSGGSQSYLAVAIALPLTLVAVVIAMGLLRWKMRSAAIRRSSTYLDRRCLKNSKAPPPYADAQQLASAPPSAAVVAVGGRKLSSRLSATLPRLPRAPDVRRLPQGFWTVSRALSSGSTGSGGLAASTSLPCLCLDEEAIVSDLQSRTAAEPPAGGDTSSLDATCAKVVVVAPTALPPGPAATAEDDRRPPPSPVAASAASLSTGAPDNGATALPADESDSSVITIAARAWMATSSIDRIDEEHDDDVAAASNDDVVDGRSLPAMVSRESGSAIGARFFPLCMSMPEISAPADNDQEDADDERHPDETDSDGESAFSRHSSKRRRSTDAADAAGAAANSPAARSPLGLAFRSTPIFMDDLGFEPKP